MLSGMNVKPAAVTAAAIEAFVEAGHTVTVLKPRKVKRHWLRTKSQNRKYSS